MAVLEYPKLSRVRNDRQGTATSPWEASASAESNKVVAISHDESEGPSCSSPLRPIPSAVPLLRLDEVRKLALRDDSHISLAGIGHYVGYEH